MRISGCLSFIGLLLTGITRPAHAQRDSGLVDLHLVAPAIRISPGHPALLVQPGVAAALAKVAKRLATGGLALEVMAGRSADARHHDGSSVDCRLVDLSRGTLLPMGSDYSGSDRPDTVAVTGREARYRALLKTMMTGEGFVSTPGMWWHWELN